MLQKYYNQQMGNMNKKTDQIKQILERAEIEVQIKEFSQPTRTAQEAADVIGCTLGQIAKSLVFKGKESGKPILVIASGSNRVDPEKVKDILKEEIDKADADFVLKETGFVIGGVPPFGHSTNITPIIDEDLLQYNEIWAAAGTENSVFKITPQDLVNITQGEISDIKAA
jgi:prolyl-tRNA editing enzyme YbaK/EbsC (Cys-tRNA(Pro) deacylase)